MPELLSVDTVFFTVLDYPMSYLEFVGTLLYLASVWLVVRRHMLTWPIGIISVVLFMLLFYQIQLYSDALEQGYYLAASLYGWWYWSSSRDAATQPVAVSYGSRRAMVSSVAAIGVGTFALAAITSRLHLWWPAAFSQPAALPTLDAFTTVMSFVAMWLLARRHVESWALWIIVDVLAIGIYFSKDVVFIAALYALLLVFACKGFVEWHIAARRGEVVPA